MLCFQRGTVIGAFIFHFVSLVIPFTKMTCFLHPFFSTWSHSVNHSEVFFWTRHCLQKPEVAARRAVFQRGAAPSASFHLRARGRIPSTGDEEEIWPDERRSILKTLSEVPACVYVSCGHRQHHRTPWQKALLLVSGWGFRVRGSSWQLNENSFPSRSTSVFHFYKPAMMSPVWNRMTVDLIPPMTGGIKSAACAPWQTGMLSASESSQQAKTCRSFHSDKYIFWSTFQHRGWPHHNRMWCFWNVIFFFFLKGNVAQ